MASKKYSFLLGLLSLVTFSAAQAQTSGSATVYRGSGYDVNDTALVPTRRMDQQRDFLNRNYDYPAKPRNQWELGIGVGALNVSGDVRSKNAINTLKGNALNTMAWNISLRKAWGYVISTRLQYIQGAATGFNWQPTQSHLLQNANPYTLPYTISPGNPEIVYSSYKTQVRMLHLDMIAALNNIKFHRAKNKMSTYGIFGIGGLLYAARVDTKDAAGNYYNYRKDIYDQVSKYTSINPNGNSPLWTNGYKTVRKESNTRLRDMFDGEFETAAERQSNRGVFGDKYTFRPVATTGMGVQFRLGRRVSLGIEDKVTFTMDDLIDGQRWQEPNRSVVSGSTILGSGATTRDFDNINYLSLNLGINLGAKSIAPLWWVNPMDFAYNELSTGRRAPKNGGPSPCDVDTDGDGVSDCFDKCNDTPLGVAVDTKGCCLDTDGDGVCDYKDKQLITPTECQPVDADGIGKCPDPACCTGKTLPPACGGMNSGNIQFTPGSTKLSGSAMNQLNSLATQMRSNPSCKVIVAGNGTTKLEQQRSWMRVSQVINYMNSQGIDRERFCFEYGQSGMGNSVDYSVAAPNASCGTPPPPPNPQLK
jgi:OmpA-OmpF porin, OOP family